MTTHVIVVGSANHDYVAACAALPAAGETRLAERLDRFPGGKGLNQAVACARLGAKVHFMGAVGDDETGAMLVAELQVEGVDTSEIEINPLALTGMAFVSVLPDGENAITVVPGANFTVDPMRIRRAVERHATPDTIVVVQCEIPVAAVEAAVLAAADAGARVVLNAAPYVELPDAALSPADPLVVNESEAAALCNRPIADLEDARRAAGDLLARARSVVVTLGAGGAFWATREAHGHVAAVPVAKVVDTTGAGDAFIGGVATMLGQGGDLETAVRIGASVGSVAVTRAGAQTSYPLRADIPELDR